MRLGLGPGPDFQPSTHLRVSLGVASTLRFLFSLFDLDCSESWDRSVFRVCSGPLSVLKTPNPELRNADADLSSSGCKPVPAAKVALLLREDEGPAASLSPITELETGLQTCGSSLTCYSSSSLLQEQREVQGCTAIRPKLTFPYS